MHKIERTDVEEFLRWAAGIFAQPEALREGSAELLDGIWYSDHNVRGFVPGSGRAADADPRTIAVQHSFGGHFPREWLGTLKVIRMWPYASAQKTHAEVTSGPLASRHVIVEQYATSTNIWAFSSGYLDHDTELGKKLTESTRDPHNPHRFTGNQN